MIHPGEIRISDYLYDLPEELIAKYPPDRREDSKLLVFRSDQISSGTFSDLENLLGEETILVFNDTKVIQARIIFTNSKNQPIEVFCLEPEGEISAAMLAQGKLRYRCLVGNLRRWGNENLVLSVDGLSLSVSLIEKQSDHVLVEFSWNPSGMMFADMLQAIGNIPIPPYLKRQSEALDLHRYQTVYARNKGSVAAPTAGLHFTGDLLNRLKERGVQTCSLTLHVGAGTFKPVKAEFLKDHEMHAEWIEVDRDFIIELIRIPGRRIIPVGTTSLRSLESLYWMGSKILEDPGITLAELEIGQWEVYQMHGGASAEQSLRALVSWMDAGKTEKLICKTRIMIAPPYQLKLASGLITNFHQPGSTLLLLISAIIGDKWREVYSYAMNHGFRFLSYGDSSLLLK